LKRAASIARLFAPIVGMPAYSTLDVIDAARRQVGRARDLDILPGVLAGLKCAPATRDILMRAIAIERGKIRGEHAIGEATRFRGQLAAAAAAVAEWDLGLEAYEALLSSLRLTYRSAKKRGRAAWASADADDLHELRVRVVDLGHQCAVFEPAWPAMFAAHGAELHRLRQALGDHNDLTVLGEFALARRELSTEASEQLVKLVLRRRRPLERKAAAQFERIFAERPGAFARRIAGYLAHPQQGPPSKAQG
jgi:CHAD domain-containing protein